MKKTIFLIGDSIFGKLKQPDLVRFDHALNAATINCAYGGATSRDAVDRYAWCSNIRNSTFVLSIGHNDIYRKTPLHDFRQNVMALLSCLDNAAKTYVLLPPPVDTITQEEQGGLFNKSADQYIKTICTVADTFESVTIVDLSSIFYSFLNDHHDYHDTDGVHMNELGIKIIIDGLHEII